MIHGTPKKMVGAVVGSWWERRAAEDWVRAQVVAEARRLVGDEMERVILHGTASAADGATLTIGRRGPP